MIFQQCQSRLNDTYQKPVLRTFSEVTHTANKEYPLLTDNIYREDVIATEIMHEGIGVYGVRVKSLIIITLNYRLYCAPISLDKFYLYRISKDNANSTRNNVNTPSHTHANSIRILLTDVSLLLSLKRSLPSDSS